MQTSPISFVVGDVCTQANFRRRFPASQKILGTVSAVLICIFLSPKSERDL